MKNTKYEQLKFVIQQANPPGWGKGDCFHCDGTGEDYLDVCDQCNGKGEVTYGRLIGIADVLLAIRKDKKQPEWYMRSDGSFFKWHKFASGESGHNEVKSTYVQWNLKDDSLDNQSDETKQFLNNLLTK